MLRTLTSIHARVNSLRSEDGNAAEYGLIIAGVAVVIIAGLALLGPAISALFTSVAGKIK